MRLLAAFILLSAPLALAQTATVESTDLSRGTNLPPSAAAWADDATALVYNPAGLGRAGLLNAVYLHERSNTRLLDNDGLFLASALGDTFGLGFSFESLRPGASEARTRTALGASYGPQAISGGASVNWYAGGDTHGLVSLDVGVQSRPVRWLALGALVRNLNAPSNGAAGFAREWGLSVGLRPLGERVSVGIDWLASEPLPADRSRMQYTVNAEVLKGFHLLAGVSHGFRRDTPLIIHAGLSIDIDRFGYTQGVAFTGGRMNWQYMARLSVEKYRSVVPRKKIAVISLADLGESTGNLVGSLLGLSPEDRFLRFLRFLDRAALDPELVGVILKVENASVGLARADELRSAVMKLRASGKPVLAYVLTGGDAEYLVASACDRIYAAPEAMLIVDGLRSSVQYLGGAAEQLGVDVDVARVGKYKNFPDQFTRKDMSPEQREALDAYLDTASRTLQQRVSETRKLTAEQWQASVDEGLKSVARAKAVGHIDDVLTPAAFEDKLGELFPGARLDTSYRPFDERDTRWGGRRVVAVVPVIGGISGGKSQLSPLGGQAVGAESFIEALNRAAEDGEVAAIVVRVDSGGGDALASDLMYRAVLEAKKKKPVVTSMGDAAASGGYYVAIGADEIWASPATLTGSIGVFFAKPAVKKLAEKWGITQVSLSRGKLSGITDMFDPWTDEQRVAAQKWVDASYDTFITAVADSRKKSKEEIDAVARGRVWSGEDAKARGLVDKLGGLMDAIASARTKAGITDEDFVVRVYDGGGSLLGMNLSTEGTVLERPLPSSWPQELAPLVRLLGPHAWLLTSQGVQARMEFTVDVR